jgi:hypothetical protein
LHKGYDISPVTPYVLLTIIPQWQRIFGVMEAHDLTVRYLIEPITALVGRLQSHTSAKIPLFFAFDEISNLIIDDQPTVQLALRNVSRLLHRLPVWTFVLSIQPPVHFLRAKLDSVTPFYSLPLDVEASRLLSVDKASQLSLPLEEFGKVSHLVTLGRPLWFAYRSSCPETVRRAVQYKMLCTFCYNPRNTNHVLAVLGSRIGLDPSLESRGSVKLEDEAVHSHLRWIIDFDFKTRSFHTTSQSEPVLAATAAWNLMRGSARGRFLWEETLETLLDGLESGVFDCGRSGELVARILCVLARDNVLGSMGKSTFTRRTILNYAQPFGVVDFLQALFTQSKRLLESPAVVNKNSKASIRKIFATASMNFTHFVATESSLAPGGTQELLHRLMYSQAALRLCPSQSHWDLLIPIYLGERTESFDPKKVTAMLIQVKDSDRRNPFVVQKSQYKKLFNLENPIITIQMDLGVEESIVQPTQSFSRKVFAFTISGADRTTYNCVRTKDVAVIVSKILALSPYPQLEAQSQVSEFNKRFRRHDWDGFLLQQNVEEETVADSESTSPQKKAPDDVQTSDTVSTTGKRKSKAKDASHIEADQSYPEISQHRPHSSTSKKKCTVKAKRNRAESTDSVSAHDTKPAKKKRQN